MARRSLLAVLCLLALSCAAAPAEGAITPEAPGSPHVSNAHLRGVLSERPKLTLALAAREGAELTTVTVQVPPAIDVAKRKRTLAAAIALRTPSGHKLGFTATSTPGTIRIHLLSPQPAVNLKIASPALATTPKLLEHIHEGRTRKLGLVIGTRETGGKGARLSAIVGV